MKMNVRKAWGCICAAALMSLLVCCASGCGSEKVDTSAGVAYIQELESQDVDAVTHEIREKNGDLLKEQYASRISTIKEDESQVWGMFDDFLFMGDSRCVALVTYGYFNEENVIAAPTVNIDTHLKKNMDTLTAKNPANLYLIYGVNDICCGLWHHAEDYANEYASILDEIHSRLPDTKIWVNATMPVVMGKKLTDTYNGYKLIPDWNEAVKAVVDERDFCYFIDSSDLCEKYQDLYKDDGVHFVKEFYPHWAANILISQYEYEMGGESVSTDSDQETAESSGSTSSDGDSSESKKSSTSKSSSDSKQSSESKDASESKDSSDSEQSSDSTQSSESKEDSETEQTSESEQGSETNQDSGTGLDSAAGQMTDAGEAPGYLHTAATLQG